MSIISNAIAIEAGLAAVAGLVAVVVVAVAVVDVSDEYVKRLEKASYFELEAIDCERRSDCSSQKALFRK